MHSFEFSSSFGAIADVIEVCHLIVGQIDLADVQLARVVLELRVALRKVHDHGVHCIKTLQATVAAVESDGVVGVRQVVDIWVVYGRG